MEGAGAAGESGGLAGDINEDHTVTLPGLYHPRHRQSTAASSSASSSSSSRRARARTRSGSGSGSVAPARPPRTRRPPRPIPTTCESDSEHTIPASSLPTSLNPAVPSLSATKTRRTLANLANEAMTLHPPSTSSSSSSPLVDTVDTSASSYASCASYFQTQPYTRSALDTPTWPPSSDMSEVDSTLETPPVEHADFTRWLGIHADNQRRESATASGIFDLEYELRHSTASEKDLQHRDSTLDGSTTRRQDRLSNESTSGLSIPPSPGCGLGITSDDAIHPEPTLTASFSLHHDARTSANSFYGVESSSRPASASRPPSDGYFSRTTSPNSEPFMSPGSSIFVHGGHSPALPLPGAPGGTVQRSVSSVHPSRWTTTRSYVRRNTSSSIRSLHRINSKQSLIDDQQSFPAPHPSRAVLAGQPAYSGTPAKHDTPLSRTRSASSTLAFHNDESDPHATVRKQNSFSRPSTSGVGTANYDAEVPPSSTLALFQDSFTRPTFGRSSGCASVESFSPPSEQEPSYSTAYNTTGLASRVSYADSSRTDSYISTGTSSRASSLSGLDHFPDNQYSLENELQEILLSNGELSPEALALPGDSRTGTADGHASDGRLRVEGEGHALQVAESGQGTIVHLQPGQLIQTLRVPLGTTHLMLAGCRQPGELEAMLKTTLPGLTGSLLVLDISDCQLRTLPDVISVCSHLEELNVSHNKFSSASLPSFLGYLKGLRVLIADGCGIDTLPVSLAKLQSLHTISLRGNDLQCLPSWLRHLSECLEVLLVDDNPLFGPYLDLVRPLLTGSSAPSAQSGCSDDLSAYRIIDQNLDAAGSLPKYTSPNEPPTSSTISTALPSPWVDVSFSSDRSSFMTRARSIRSGLRRASGTLRDIEVSGSSRVNSLLLADDESPSRESSRRNSVLRQMRSTGDLSSSTTPPSLDALMEGIAEETHRRPALAASSSMLSFASNGFPPPVPPKPVSKKSSKAALTVAEFFSSEGDDRNDPTSASALDEDSAGEEVDPAHVPENRGRKQSFFRKVAQAAKLGGGKMQRKVSETALRSARKPSFHRVPQDMEEDGVSQFTLGKGFPPSPAFLREDIRSASEPISTLASNGVRPDLPGLPEPRSNRTKASKGSTTQRDRHRPPRLTKPAPHVLHSPKKQRDQLQPAQSKAGKRRSYLMLNAILPPVISPGPLQLSFSLDSIHALPKSFEDDQTITMPKYTALQCTPQSHSLSDQIGFEERREALKPIMAYLRDLDDLVQEADLRPAPRLNMPGLGSLPPSVPGSRSISRKTSLAAVSSACSSRVDTSSGYESSKADSTGLSSPSVMQGPITVKDNAIKRERVISEIISSEKSYLAGLHELVALYIQPASAPYRSSGGAGAAHETVISPAERKVVFSIAESIEQFHTRVFLPALEDAALYLDTKTNRSSQHSFSELELLRQATHKIAQVFIHHAAYLKLYHSYCVNFDLALKRLAYWKSIGSGGTVAPVTSALPSPEVAATSTSAQVPLTTSQKKRIRHLLKVAKRDPRHSQIDLQSYLLLPIQRIPRYKMLLESLAESTADPENPAVPDAALMEALEHIAQLATDMNEKKRESEGRHRLLYWQGRLAAAFRSPLVQPHRVLLKEGTLRLNKVVKRKLDLVSSGSLDSRPEYSSALQIQSLVIEQAQEQLTYILCNDILVLVRPLAEPSTGPVELWNALQLGQAVGREDPASVFGSSNLLRLVDARAVLYLACSDVSEAAHLSTLINRLSRQTI